MYFLSNFNTFNKHYRLKKILNVFALSATQIKHLVKKKLASLFQLLKVVLFWSFFLDSAQFCSPS